MAQNEITKLKLTLSAFQLEYEGSAAFLQTEIPKLVQGMDRLQVPRLIIPFNILQKGIEDSLNTQEAANALIASAKAELDSMNELGETESLRLQMALDRLSKLMSTLSNISKKMSDVADSIIQNLK
jgi:hypothetical protein